MRIYTRTSIPLPAVYMMLQQMFFRTVHRFVHLGQWKCAPFGAMRGLCSVSARCPFGMQYSMIIWDNQFDVKGL